jgi:cyclopropane-fatty-acyl-phospholipid synthase
MTSTLQDIETGYDLDNEFFRLWLDTAMHYSCAVFDEEHVTLEAAQRNKSRILADQALIKPDSVVLDIGCGWGGNLQYLSQERSVERAHGITFSQAQYREAVSRNLPGVSIWCQDYETFVPDRPYDALISIEMIDHLVSPKQQQLGLAVPIYRNYFDRLARWVKPGGRFAFQAILRDRMPRVRKDLEDLRFTAEVIFPGGLNPRLEELISSCSSSWEVIALVTNRLNYRDTAAHWLYRFRQNHETIMGKGLGGRLMSNGETVWNNYERYLATCVRAFEMHWSSGVQMCLVKKA